MNLIKIKNINEQTVEVNLDCLSALEDDKYSNNVNMWFGGYYVVVDKDEYNRIREMLNQNSSNVLCEVSKTDDPITKVKEIVYKATYLDSDAKLQLIIQLENIEH